MLYHLRFEDKTAAEAILFSLGKPQYSHDYFIDDVGIIYNDLYEEIPGYYVNIIHNSGEFPTELLPYVLGENDVRPARTY